MKVDFLPDGAPDCPLIRLYDYRDGELERLRVVCRELADGVRAEFALHEQPWIDAVDGLRFIWRACSQDIGVNMPRSGEPFVLAYSDEAWREVEEKIAGLEESGRGGFNWLTMEGDVGLLISPDGPW